MIFRSGSTTARATFFPGYRKRVQRYWPSQASRAVAPSANSTTISTGRRTSPSRLTVTSASKDLSFPPSFGLSATISSSPPAFSSKPSRARAWSLRTSTA
jgi:hypothetical protein